MDIYPAAERRVKYPPLSPTPGEAYRRKCYGLLKGFSTISFSTLSDLSLHDNTEQLLGSFSSRTLSGGGSQQFPCVVLY